MGESFSVSQWVIVSNWRYVANASPSFVSLLIFHNHASKYITHHKLEMMFFSFSMPDGGFSVYICNGIATNANSSAGMSTHPAPLNFVVKWADAGQSIVMH